MTYSVTALIQDVLAAVGMAALAVGLMIGWLHLLRWVADRVAREI